LDKDALFEILSNRRRRYVLHYLKQNGSSRTDLSDLSTQIAAWEQQVPTENLRYDDRKSVHTALAQFHLPKMDNAGVVEFESQRNAVELTPEGDNLSLYLEAVQDDDIPWSVYFLLLAAVGATLVGGVLANAPGLAAFTAGDVAIFFISVFGLSALAFFYDSRYRMRIGQHGPPPTHDIPER
jgi:hypothetical protein